MTIPKNFMVSVWTPTSSALIEITTVPFSFFDNNIIIKYEMTTFYSYDKFKIIIIDEILNKRV